MLTDLPTQTKLYPPIKPYATHYLDRGDGHLVYFEECGNPNGMPILFFHGGPGAGCSAKDRRYFDPKKWRIILFDQRGCGKSKPLYELEYNETPYLVDDAEKILDRLNIQKAVLFGGSWGSTLALVFAIHNPERVRGMILRGIYLGEDGELDYSQNGLIAQHFPEDWERFASALPPAYRNDLLEGYRTLIDKFIEKGDQEKLKRIASEWVRYEDGHLSLRPLSKNALDKEMKKYQPGEVEASAAIETYYFINSCFLMPSFIIKNINDIPNVPISIIHGIYDVICPLANARRLEVALRLNHTQVRMQHTFAGHSKSDPENRKRLIYETNLMYEKVKPRK